MRLAATVPQPNEQKWTIDRLWRRNHIGELKMLNGPLVAEWGMEANDELTTQVLA